MEEKEQEEKELRNKQAEIEKSRNQTDMNIKQKKQTLIMHNQMSSRQENAETEAETYKQ
jgi:hypothetical protein